MQEVITLENFHWVGLVIWLLVIVSFLSLVIGIYKKSGKLLLLSALTISPMTYYLFGAESWIKLAILIPIIEVILAIIFGFNSKKTDKVNM